MKRILSLIVMVTISLGTVGLAISRPIKPPVNHHHIFTYIAKPGDTLWDVANKYHASMKQIKRDSDITDNLYPGDELVIEVPEAYVDHN